MARMSGLSGKGQILLGILFIVGFTLPFFLVMYVFRDIDDFEHKIILANLYENDTVCRIRLVDFDGFEYKFRCDGICQNDKGEKNLNCLIDRYKSAKDNKIADGAEITERLLFSQKDIKYMYKLTKNMRFRKYKEKFNPMCGKNTLYAIKYDDNGNQEYIKVYAQGSENLIPLNMNACLLYKYYKKKYIID